MHAWLLDAANGIAVGSTIYKGNGNILVESFTVGESEVRLGLTGLLIRDTTSIQSSDERLCLCWLR